MSSNVVDVSNKGGMLLSSLSSVLFFKMLGTWVGKREKCYMKGSPSRFQQCGSVWPWEHL